MSASLRDQVLAQFSAQLAVQDLSATDDFFSHGGTSLTAIRLLTRLKSTVDPGITIVELFTNPTAASLAEAIERRRKEDEADE